MYVNSSFLSNKEEIGVDSLLNNREVSHVRVLAASCGQRIRPFYRRNKERRTGHLDGTKRSIIGRATSLSESGRVSRNEIPTIERYSATLQRVRRKNSSRRIIRKHRWTRASKSAARPAVRRFFKGGDKRLTLPTFGHASLQRAP